MRRFLSPSTLVPCAIIAAVAAMVVSANLREGRLHGRPSTTLPPLGTVGAPSTSREGLMQRVAEMDARLQKNPDDPGAAVLLADALIRQSRVTGDGGLTMRAATVLEHARRESPGHYDVLHMLGTLNLSQHKFRDALTVAEQCIALRPADASNYGILGDAHLELGDYDQAFDAYDRMMQLRPNAASYARVAYARELQGDLDGALDSMELAAEAAGGGDVEGQAWYRAQVGELHLSMDKPYDAMRDFAAASQVFPGHPFAVIGYAKALDAVGKSDEALALLQDLVTRTPTPDVEARIGDLLTKKGQSADAERAYARAEAAWRSDAPEPKNLARFLAERGSNVTEAIAIAEGALAVRQDIFTQDALAWAYFKGGRIDDARRMMTAALRTGSRDREILRHAAALGIDASSQSRLARVSRTVSRPTLTQADVRSQQ